MAFSHILYYPLHRLSVLSKAFIEDLSIDSFKSIEPLYYNIREFNEIEAVLRKGYVIMQERNVAVKALTQITSAAAHDVCSPLTALKMALDQMESKRSKDLQLQCKQALLAYEAVLKIVQEFKAANNEFQNPNMSINGKNQKATEAEVKVISPIMPIIDYILEIKRYQFTNNNIQFTKNIDPDAQNLCANVNLDHLKRILSNIVNNSVEAIVAAKRINDGKVEIILTKEGNMLLIAICDNGCGMSQELINKLGQEGISTKQEVGHGIGLFSAIYHIKDWGGDYKIISEIGVGTKVIIYLPWVKPPDQLYPKN